jgi:HPt (histidine-containing phosphotransfer) domain-containing protein
MSDPVDEAFQKLRLEYLAALPARLQELRSDVAAWQAGNADALSSLQIRLHRLAGSGGSYGFAELSSVAREAERWIMRHGADADRDRLKATVDRLVEAAAGAGAEVRRVGG